jgi:creatinine amidohydrolase
VVRDLGASVSASGFKKVVIYNTHGGNTSLVDVLARDLRAEFGLRTFSLFGSPGAEFEGVSKQERTYGFHAGEIETAFLLHATPELVHPEEYTANYIARVDAPELLNPEGSSANFAWLTQDIAPSGVMGDPSNATADNGERWSNEAATRITEILVAMYNFEPRHGA